MFAARCLRIGLTAGVASLTLIGAATSGAAADAASAGAWAQPGYGPGQTYYNPGETTINATTMGKVADRFTTDLPEAAGESCTRPAPPLVSGGRVFVADTTGIGAYAAGTGKPLWQHTWQNPEDKSTPYLAVSNGLLLAGTSGCQSASDPNGTVRALDVTNGRQRWAQEFDTPVDSLVVDRSVVAVGGESESDLPTVRGLDVTTGRLRWTLPRFTSPGVASQGRLLLTRTTAAQMVAVNVTTGKALWTRPQKWQAEMATADRFFVTNGAGTLISLNAVNGASQWTAPKAAGRNATDGRRIYHPTGRTVEAFDVTTGKRVWWRTFLGDVGQPVRAGGLVYAAVQGRTVGVMNAANGQPIATTWTSGLASTNRVTVAAGHIYTVAGNTLTGSGL
ncbi:outer membrane protein assembly factor BamB family protein [Actinoplanes sp. RD1]|uniref:outer membrane protein assembly factor BamB family protein n=1 Tax=Actinoplanes sp. RD1 TaxID=3064538 RepID=UPI0027412B6D|nr:PQQ-binding-like beta-propeller repeat protein [Actinoplanes sp. RD1]